MRICCELLTLALELRMELETIAHLCVELFGIRKPTLLTQPQRLPQLHHSWRSVRRTIDAGCFHRRARGHSHGRSGRIHACGGRCASGRARKRRCQWLVHSAEGLKLGARVRELSLITFAFCSSETPAPPRLAWVLQRSTSHFGLPQRRCLGCPRRGQHFAKRRCVSRRAGGALLCFLHTPCRLVTIALASASCFRQRGGGHLILQREPPAKRCSRCRESIALLSHRALALREGRFELRRARTGFGCGRRTVLDVRLKRAACECRCLSRRRCAIFRRDLGLHRHHSPPFRLHRACFSFSARCRLRRPPAICLGGS
mmetsp:Transcript_33787/g.109176  ORF Transcript_33787/g.109176 Transcript_33787/m.109176 type:complete len:315 (+) Transcript_33787:1022-1966(+)